MQTGNDSDSHGCIGSAGYQWSQLLQDCIRVFELPLQLFNATGSALAGVAFSNDKAEVFTANGDFILEKKSDSEYISETYHKFLNQTNGKWQFGDSSLNQVEYKEK
jgi:hypothetical protein